MTFAAIWILCGWLPWVWIVLSEKGYTPPVPWPLTLAVSAVCGPFFVAGVLYVLTLIIWRARPFRTVEEFTRKTEAELAKMGY